MKPEKVKTLAKQSTLDHIINGIKALISAYPFGGGIIASLISDYIPKSRERRTLEFLQQVAQDIENAKERINNDYIRSEEFEYLFQKAWRVAIENYQKEKIEGFRAILINSALGKEASPEDKDLFINILNDLTGYHFQMLKVFQNPIDWNTKNGNMVQGASYMTSLNQIFNQCFPGWGDDRLVFILDDLFNKKLCTISSDRLKTMTTGGGIEKLNHALTSFGRRFIDYVTL